MQYEFILLQVCRSEIRSLYHWAGGYHWMAEEEEGNRGWDGWIASSMQWTWTWVNSARWWGTGKPGVLQSTGSRKSRLWLGNWTTPSLGQGHSVGRGELLSGDSKGEFLSLSFPVPGGWLYSSACDTCFPWSSKTGALQNSDHSSAVTSSSVQLGRILCF